jgi:aspartyl-tRNA(Asn)/glutamyl-tRNA(Gln) amidotransferase subunit C
MKIDVTHIAKLANIPLPKEKEAELEKALEATLEHIKSLEDIDTSKVSGTNEVTDLENVFREDVVESSLTQEEALQNAKSTYKGFFKVPATLGEGMDS